MRYFVILLLTLLVSCSAGTNIRTVRSDEDMLRDRAAEYCEARRQFNWKAIHQMLAPDLRQDMAEYFETLEKKGKKAELLACDVNNIDLKGDNAVVALAMTIRIENPLAPNLAPQKYEMKDEWSRVEGTWYLRMKKPNLSEFLQRSGIPRKGGGRQ